MIDNSVVMATYQGERFIDEQLDSILAQLGGADELIVSDDASSDRTLEHVRRRNDSRIRIIANGARLGYIGNFQRAVEAVRGRFVFFSDQDDVWLPGKVSALREALDIKAFAASDAIVVDEGLTPTHGSFFKQRGADSFSWPTLFRKPSIIGATMSCRAEYLRKLLPLPAGVPHDFWLSFNAAWDDQLSVLTTPLILYRRHSKAHSPTATATTRTFQRIVRERLALALNVALLRLRRPL